MLAGGVVNLWTEYSGKNLTLYWDLNLLKLGVEKGTWQIEGLENLRTDLQILEHFSVWHKSSFLCVWKSHCYIFKKVSGLLSGFPSFTIHQMFGWLKQRSCSKLFLSDINLQNVSMFCLIREHATEKSNWFVTNNTTKFQWETFYWCSIIIILYFRSCSREL